MILNSMTRLPLPTGLMLIASMWAGYVQAQNAAPATPAPKAAKAKSGSGAPFAGFGANSRQPVQINANKLEVIDKENRAVYSGDVVAVQGQTTLRCSIMTIFYSQGQDQKSKDPKSKETKSEGSSAQNSIKKIDCAGPVSVVSGTQAMTSKNAIYEADIERVTMTGSVVISDGDNVQRGERVVYDVKTGVATVDAGAKGRVQGIFIPGSADDKKKDDKKKLTN